MQLLVRAVGVFAFSLIIGVFMFFVLINWVSGCGERFPTANGGYIEGECVTPLNLFTREPVSGENK
jgi:hypothetical protein